MCEVKLVALNVHKVDGLDARALVKLNVRELAVLGVREPARIVVLVPCDARPVLSRKRNVQAAQNPSQNRASSFLCAHVGLILACIR